MSSLPLALSLSSRFTELGAVVAFIALFGIAVLSLLVFSQAREIKRLREWAGRAPERSAELEQRVTAQAAARLQQPRATAQPVRRLPAQPAAQAQPAQAAQHAAAASAMPAAPGRAQAAAVAAAGAAAPSTGAAAASLAGGPAPATAAAAASGAQAPSGAQLRGTGTLRGTGSEAAASGAPAREPRRRGAGERPVHRRRDRSRAGTGSRPARGRLAPDRLARAAARKRTRRRRTLHGRELSWSCWRPARRDAGGVCARAGELAAAGSGRCIRRRPHARPFGRPAARAPEGDAGARPGGCGQSPECVRRAGARRRSAHARRRSSVA